VEHYPQKKKSGGAQSGRVMWPTDQAASAYRYSLKCSIKEVPNCNVKRRRSAVHEEHVIRASSSIID
jgi:hypothetical protein